MMSDFASETDLYDVVVCGGGPAGLVTAFGLQRMGLKTCVIEAVDKFKLMYGRASLFHPRSLEMLDQYGLLHDMEQIGVPIRSAMTYKDGKRITTRGHHLVYRKWPHNTFMDHMLSLRLKYIEEICRRHYENVGGQLMVGWKLSGLHIHDKAEDGYKVTTTISKVGGDQTTRLHSKYIVGADGGSSAVRTLAGIQFEPTGSPYRWIRIDAVIETNMPDAYLGAASIESPNHGNVLFINLDHGRVRIGYAMNPMLIEKYGDHMTQENALYEAQQAMLPFTCEFKTVDWWTCYSVKQAVADEFVKDECVVLAGDAAHVHSSAAAQGMNVGIHDATNLAWKLAGIIKGQLKPSVLTTYHTERRPQALHLIELDKTFATLISGKIPSKYKSSDGETVIDPNELINQVLTESANFTSGLGISYPIGNSLNEPSTAGILIPGFRAPDELLYAPNSRVPIRLQTITPNFGNFWILVFAGEPLHTQPLVKKFRDHLDGPNSFLKQFDQNIFKFLTLIAGTKTNGQGALGCERFGDIYFDRALRCHEEYGFSIEEGGICVLRPEGLIGFATWLDTGEELTAYFERFMIRTDKQ